MIKHGSTMVYHRGSIMVNHGIVNFHHSLTLGTTMVRSLVKQGRPC